MLVIFANYILQLLFCICLNQPIILQTIWKSFVDHSWTELLNQTVYGHIMPSVTLFVQFCLIYMLSDF